MPIYAPLRSAINDFQNGRIGSGLLKSIMAATDLFAVRDILYAIASIKSSITAELKSATPRTVATVEGDTVVVTTKDGPTGYYNDTHFEPGNAGSFAKSINEKATASAEAEAILKGLERGPIKVLGPTCFVAGTPLLTPNGSKAIEDLCPGDYVLSRPERDIDGWPEPKEVEAVFVREAPVLWLTVSGRLFGTTEEHPFYVVGKGWRCAGTLEYGDLLSSHNACPGVIESLRREETLTTVYNLRVADWHTYFVGCEEWGFSVSAHNADYEWFVHDSQVFLRDAEGKLIRTPYTEANLQKMMGDARLTRIEPPAKINPDRFLNQQPFEVLGPHPQRVPDPAHTFSKRGTTGRYDYVVLEDGSLVVGESIPGAGHANLAQGNPVKAAGVIEFQNGKVVYIDNASGHFIPIGGKAKFSALDAFEKIGVEIPTASYIEKRWNDVDKIWEEVK